MKIIFMGTPDFSVYALEALAPKHQIVGVFTQTDKKSGRGKKLRASAVKTKALAMGLPVYQYKNVNCGESLELIKSLEADLIVVVAFGQILSPELLAITTYGCFNIHASRLPRWRGAAPIQAAIRAGDKKTGVTIIQMDKGLDTGDMLLIKEVAISEQMTGGELHDILAVKGAEAIVEVLAQVEAGSLTPVKQDDSLSTYATMINKEMTLIDWNQPAEQIVNLIRAYNPFPTAHTFYQNQRLKIYRAEVYDKNSDQQAGAITAIKKDSLIVQAADGQVEVKEIQFVNSKRMSVDAYLRGHQLQIGQVLTAD